jgi:hypothetical protein
MSVPDYERRDHGFSDQGAPASHRVQQMAVYVEEIGIITKSRDDVLIPDLGQHGTAGACQSTPPFYLRPTN